MYESAGIIGDVWAFATKCYMGWNPKFQVIYQVVFLFCNFPLILKLLLFRIQVNIFNLKEEALAAIGSVEVWFA